MLEPDNQASCFSHEKEEISLGIYQASTMHDRWLVALASLWLYYTQQYNALDYIKGMWVLVDYQLEVFISEVFAF